MIRVSLKHDENGCLTGFSVKGHAGYRRFLFDKVCEAVSVAAQSTLYGLEQVVNAKLYSNMYDGYLELEVLPSQSAEVFNGAQVLLKTFELTIRSLANDYPKNITIDTTQRR